MQSSIQIKRTQIKNFNRSGNLLVLFSWFKSIVNSQRGYYRRLQGWRFIRQTILRG